MSFELFYSRDTQVGSALNFNPKVVSLNFVGAPINFLFEKYYVYIHVPYTVKKTNCIVRSGDGLQQTPTIIQYKM